MPWSHHSHSGQFCGHATDTLEAVVQHAISKRMTTFCLTEHITRSDLDLYPEEISSGQNQASLARIYDDFYHEARRLQKLYADQIQLFVGFEGEWIREGSEATVKDLFQRYEVDLFVGSVHHVHGFPIDFDTATYHKAREVAGGSDERMFEDYFDAQLAMLKALRPPVVGHFDLIRLKSDDPDRSFKAWPKVWEKLVRNLEFVAEYGGVVELNSSSLRKGMKECYPQVEICKTFHAMGGRFTLSDDSHGIPQVGLNYGKVLQCVERAGITELWHLAPIGPTSSDKLPDPRFPNVRWIDVQVTKLKEHGFWTKPER
ncbi:hypothetical protein LTR35_006560 [Friedmanniomyces endolithicus]|uniref:Histidinol-phosphatase n=1 Tax=Friedmanniomyces endolithicus TaxID=329885 RepID=A0A4V5N937_9PEZI|nr:hypothetical protein LTS09_003795 [Friedmanniomyces endolithicus]KAK0282768.1 hypothetical protein LTR35_006560 [Friedmanniomyces endolithicus]KAK0297179.1 hypothetical protein LTS00_004458 [Friedmanniomyces endolithicus]KAK0320616.1 hypothetical protein LTR82_008329 [Friedmanniomyces endolithicus]KAK1012695.1 hypothetical protein LTR54_004622 [Friedmanniomyces endolithicus]